MPMKKVIVASKNPVKIKCTHDGFARMFPEELFEVEGISASSGVSDQPMSEQETLQGAIARAQNASVLVPEANYWVGIEGGLEEIDNPMEAFAWIVVKSKANVLLGKGRTG